MLGWIEICGSEYQKGHKAFLECVQPGKIKHGYIYERMKQTRKEFRSNFKVFQMKENEFFDCFRDRKKIKTFGKKLIFEENCYI